MLKSLHNHKASSSSLRCLPLLSQPTRSLNGGLLVWADAEKKIQVSDDDEIDCNWVFTSTADRTEGKYNFWDVMGWRNRKSNSDDPTRASDWVARSARVSHGACAIPNVVDDCKHRRGRGTAVIQRKYRSSEVKKSITKAIIDRNAPRWFTTNLMFSQKPKLIRSVASDGLPNIYKRRVSLNIYKKGANKFGRKIGFKVENESEDHNQSSPKSVGILTMLKCIFGLNLVILAWMADE